MLTPRSTADGAILRGRGNLGHGHWKVLTRHGWQEVQDELVAEVRLERDVLPEAMEGHLELGARCAPAARELVIAALLSCGARHRNELERRLHEERAKLEPRRRAFGEQALRELFPVGPAASGSHQ